MKVELRRACRRFCELLPVHLALVSAYGTTMRMLRSSRVPAAVVLSLPLLIAAAHQDVDGHAIEHPSIDDWLSYGRTYTEQRFSPLTQINRDTVGKLKLAWWSEFDTDRGQEATPLVHNGVLYTTTAWSKVFAFDAKTGTRLWSYDPKVPGETGFNACCDVVNRGVALWSNKVYVGTLDGRLIALDAKSGKPVWSVQTTDPSLPYTITGAPRAVKGKILIGNGGAEFPVRGYVSAYDADTGKLAWRFYMTPNPNGAPDHAASDQVMKEKAAATWGEGSWKRGGGGGTPWDAITYDAQSDLVFVGTGNAGPWDDDFRTSGIGDNLFAASIVALRPETGAYVWHYQTTPRDAWDYDATQQLMLADLKIDGKPRHVLMQANKNGFFYVLDAANGKLISATKFVPTDWAERVDLSTGRPIENPEARYAKSHEPSSESPGGLGGHNWQPMAYSPQERLVYIPAQTSSSGYTHAENPQYVQGALNIGVSIGGGVARQRGQGLQAAQASQRSVHSVSPSSSGEVLAWDPVAGSARWRASVPQMWHSGILATAGGLVLNAAGHELTAYDAASGKVLWTYDTIGDPVAAPMSYAVDGTQYIALMIGWGGAPAMGGPLPRHPGRLLIFKLDGKARLPPYPPVTTPPPLDLTVATPSHGDPHAGQATYLHWCGRCHNPGVFLPDLKKSPAILTPDGFKAIVYEGALKARGMAPFRRFLSESDVENMRAYLLTQAANGADHPPVPEPLAHPQ